MRCDFGVCTPWVGGGIGTGDSRKEENKVVTGAARLWTAQVFGPNVSFA